MRFNDKMIIISLDEYNTLKNKENKYDVLNATITSLPVLEDTTMDPMALDNLTRTKRLKISAVEMENILIALYEKVES